MTFSIVAYSAAEQAWGVAVASKFLAAPASVSWARAGVGAVATQALARVSFGPQGLDLMAGGMSAADTLAHLLASDDGREHRQVGLVDARGSAAAYTGAECMDYAGQIVGEAFTCQGNILAGRHVLEAMAGAYQSETGTLARRLAAALLAADRAGGDRRGRQSAGVTVVKAGGGYGGDNDRLIDLRVDDHEDPVVRLQELMALHDLYFGKSNSASRLPITADLAVELQSLLVRLGYQQGPITSTWDEAAREAFWRFVGQENFEERWSPGDHPELIDPVLLDFIRRHFSAQSGKSGIGSEYSGYLRQFPADIIYHITRAEYYAAQPADRPYLPEAYAKDGFIHCTRGADLMATVANKHYRSTPGDFLMLVLSTRALTSPLKHESFDAELPFPFPHIYGPINREAILEVVKMKRASDGMFLVPPFADEPNPWSQQP